MRRDRVLDLYLAGACLLVVWLIVVRVMDEPLKDRDPGDETPEPRARRRPLLGGLIGMGHTRCPRCSACNRAAVELERRYGEGDGIPQYPRNSVATVRARDGALYCRACDLAFYPTLEAA